MNLARFLPKAWKERVRHRLGAITLSRRLQNLQRAGFRPSSVIDAGAFRGCWAMEALEVFPDVGFLLIEPQENCQPSLRALAARHPKVQICQTLLGETAADMRLLVEGSNSRILTGDCEPPAHARVEVHRVRTLLDVASEHGFAACDFLKLDLQGHELSALAGAGPMFGRCEVIMTEVSWLRIGDVPLVQEVIAAFVAKGYRPYDVLGHNYRRRDRALWQTDLIFVREDSPLIASREWA